MKITPILAAIVATTLTTTSASALSYLSSFGTGVEGTAEGTVRVDSDGTPVTETTRGNRGGKGKNR